MKLSDTEYRQMPRFSNSDLSEFKRLLIGDNRKLPKTAFKIGSVFHAMLLEPATVSPEVWATLTEIQQDQVLAMFHSANKDVLLNKYLQSDRREEVFLFEEEGLKCKAKIDLLPHIDKVVDIKTTSAKTYQGFVEAILKYDYHRQGAFYARAAQRPGTIFVGIQKQAPFDIFHVDLTHWTGPASMEAGRHLYLHLIRQIKQSNFIPSSWKVQELS